MSKFNTFLILFLVCSTVVVDASTPFVYANMFKRGIGRLLTPRIPFGAKMLLGGKALLFAPVTFPLAVAGKAMGAGIIAGPALLGASIGAPIGAVGGAMAGAAAGAAKGAMVGKAILLTKLALAAKAAKMAAVPFVVAHKVKKVILLKKIKLGVHAMKYSGLALKKIGAAKVKAAGALIAYKGKIKAKMTAARAAPQPEQQVERVEQVRQQVPPVLDTQFVLNTPLTGQRFARVHVTGN